MGETRLNNYNLTTKQELELINSYTRTALKEEDVYIFTVTLCDNEVDRDFDCFSRDSLKELEKLFVGRTGIFDHSMRSKDQSARIFYCFIDEDETALTSYGEKYAALKARAYMLKTDSNAELIKSIDGGIKKEVSVSCSAGNALCSICGKDMRTNECSHIKGRVYNDSLCYSRLENITDAYEWSFVAVPAQRQAGVSKSFSRKAKKEKAAKEIIKTMTEGTVLTKKEIEKIREYVNKVAEDAAVYKNHLIDEISRYALIIMPQVSVKGFICACSNMDIDELKSLKDDMGRQAHGTLPLKMQLKPYEEKREPDNNDFII